jgi:hypothetical protein
MTGVAIGAQDEATQSKRVSRREPAGVVTTMMVVGAEKQRE